ncbi:hypothetical protein B0H14DRAFT_3579021 [Mycena olivaceomarginata]|nr:hypothetical protein B0H14DRAFT_3579021 [Mycena olivaceomarginata]
MAKYLAHLSFVLLHHRSSTPPTLGPITSSLRPTLKHVADTVILVPKPGLTKLDGARSSEPPVRRIKAVIESLPPLFDLNIKLALGENVADGFNNTLCIVGSVANQYISLADVLALAAIAAIENCSSPSIPFRGGRIDIAAPNAPGVPQPQEDLATHTATFKRQGFSKTEMIGLLVCGHTFGGVAHPPFPNVVPDLNDPSNMQSVVHFDGTPRSDNHVMRAPLTRREVVGMNVTTNSDARIFGSGGGKVMRGVFLSKVLMPLPVKPDALQLMLDGDKLLFAGEVRVREWLSMSGTVIPCLLGVIQADGVVLRVDLACFMISNQANTANTGSNTVKYRAIRRPGRNTCEYVDRAEIRVNTYSGHQIRTSTQGGTFIRQIRALQKYVGLRRVPFLPKRYFGAKRPCSEPRKARLRDLVWETEWFAKAAIASDPSSESQRKAGKGSSDSLGSHLRTDPAVRSLKARFRVREVVVKGKKSHHRNTGTVPPNLWLIDAFWSITQNGVDEHNPTLKDKKLQKSVRQAVVLLHLLSRHKDRKVVIDALLCDRDRPLSAHQQSFGIMVLHLGYSYHSANNYAGCAASPQVRRTGRGRRVPIAPLIRARARELDVELRELSGEAEADEFALTQFAAGKDEEQDKQEIDDSGIFLAENFTFVPARSYPPLPPSPSAAASKLTRAPTARTYPIAARARARVRPGSPFPLSRSLSLSLSASAAAAGAAVPGDYVR